MTRPFPEALAVADSVEGWLSADQARRLWERAAGLPASALAVEIGSYRGRSAIVLASAAPDDARVVAIDPHAGNDRGPQQIEGTSSEGEADNRAFMANLERAGVAARVEHVRLPSQGALAAVAGAIDLLYVDGAHRYAPARNDIARWGERVRPGGALLIHDAFSSIGVTFAILRLLVLGSEFRYLGRSRSLAEYRRERLSGRARVRNAARQLAELPWFARNVGLKVLIAARLSRADWPY